MQRWQGQLAEQATALVLEVKGTVCHLCDLPGADTSDHEPPRCDLITDGVPDPDALRYLWPAHLLCNLRRGTRRITPRLKAELRRRRLDDVPVSPRFLSGEAIPTEASAEISPRFQIIRPREAAS